MAFPGSPDGPVRLAVVGAGNRGRRYADWCARHPRRAEVVALAEPDPDRRERLAAAHELPSDARHRDWRPLLAARPVADVVVIATPDRAHVEVATAALEAGYDLLLEKPIAPDLAGLARVRTAAAAAGREVTVAHVLRYAPVFRRLRELLDDGAIGRLVGVEHTEHIAYWHFAHSYVRGNWRRQEEASPLILAKACHDLDLLRWFAGAPCTSVASAGALTHFHARNAPEGAPTHCLHGCPVEDTCPFHAGRFYLDALGDDWDAWPVTVVTPDPRPAARRAALHGGPYGRCVYRCDNDVVDHQQTLLTFANGVTATLTVSAFTADMTRTLRLLGTGGQLTADLAASAITLRRFVPRPGATTVDETFAVGPDPAELQAHGGGDDALMAALVERVARRRRGGAPQAAVTTFLEEALDSHVMALAAEEARLRGTVVAPASLAGT